MGLEYQTRQNGWFSLIKMQPVDEDLIYTSAYLLALFQMSRN